MKVLLAILGCFLQQFGSQCSKIELGNTVDLLKDYGLLNQLLRADYQNDGLLFLQNIFNGSKFLDEYRHAIKVEDGQKNGSWSIELCDNMFHLQRALFHEYSIETVPNVAKAFTSNWSIRNKATFTGLPDMAFWKDYNFLLVKYTKVLKKYLVSVDGMNEWTKNMDERLVSYIRSIQPDSQRSIVQFISRVGSHFVSSYSLGDAVFQIFVFSRTTGEHFKKLRTENERLFQQELLKYGWIFATKVGEIRTFSEDRYTEELLEGDLKDASLPTYGVKTKRSNLLLMYNSSQVLARSKQRLRNAVPVAIDFTLISSLIDDTEKSLAVQDVIDNQIKLRELYLD